MLGLIVLGVSTLLSGNLVLSIILSIAFIALGIDIVYVNCIGFMRANNSKSWPEASGILIEGNAVHRQYCGNVYKWYLKISYIYSVSENDYQGENYNWVGFVRSDKEVVQEVIDALSSSEELLIKYNPNEPNESVISPEISILYPLGILAGLSAIIVSSFWFLKLVGILS